MIDTLTKIPSRDALNETLEKTAHPKLMLIDLKEFGELNLKYSDEAGDFVLYEFAKALEKFANENEMLAFRIRDDEFALIKDMPFDLSAMEKLIYAIEAFIKEQNYTYNNNQINIDAHIGICLDQTNLLKKANKALEVAKKENQPFVTYSDFVNRLVEESEEKISVLLQQSLDNGTLMPYYQRIIDLDGNHIYNEMLLRNNIKDSIQTPKLFLTIAHKRGFYNDIVEIISKKVVQENGKKAINLSLQDLQDEELFTFLIETFKNQNTIFELQNDANLYTENFDKKLKIIKDNNIEICLDNIEKVSQINHFETSHIDYVKVSGNIIRLLNLSDESKFTCKEIISTCKEVNIRTIASNINSNSSFEETKKLGFDYYQGYFFGKHTSNFSE